MEALRTENVRLRKGRSMLSDGRSYMHNASHMVLFPGIMIVIVVLAFNIFGDGLRDALDPKMKQ